MMNIAQKIVNPIWPASTSGQSGASFFSKLLPRMVGLGFLIGVLIFFFVILIGAIQWISSGGDKAAVEAARGKITSAIIGLVILFSLIALIKVIEDFFGLNILSLDIGALQIK